MRTIVMAHVYAVLVIASFLGLLPWLLIQLIGLRHIGAASNVVAVLGGVAVALGGALAYSCMVVFIIHGKGTAFPTDPPKHFVAIGPYRYVRNPMYIGNLLMATGVGLLLHSATYLIYVVLLAGVTHLYITLHEEPRLRERFGASYLSYCATTHRWLPGGVAMSKS